MSAAPDAFVGDLPTEIRGLLIPLSGEQLLLPNAIVAEVVNYQAPQPIEDAPTWLQGFVAWRGEIVPLVSAEQLMGLAGTAPGHRARIVVCTTVDKNSRLNYFGLVARGIPRLIRITPDSLAPVEAEKEAPGVLARLSVQGEPATILDVDGLERQLLSILPG